MSGRLLILALPGLPAIEPGDDLAALIATALQRAAADDDDYRTRPGDVLVVTQKVVSKAEGRIVDLRTVEPRPEAVEFAARFDRDPRQVEVVLREAAEVLRMERGVVVARTRHGFVCANAGVDASNMNEPETVTLLPLDPDASAERLRVRLRESTGVDLAIVISDSFGRPWRLGITDVAIGVAGFEALDDLRGQPDTAGRLMHTTVIAVADELAAAADLAAGKASGHPVTLIRGAYLPPEPSDAARRGARAMVMPRGSDLFP
ncbi:MAG: coenzyme F420-0:L-glutamate ligase [Chloroflexi bacterium GWC2_73_18]|nr:MAG: coenzyme F420-0:L-glutamate ligase [Chloroflexi bacterium GWC2_73_18]